MSRPLGFERLAPLAPRRGESDGDKDFSEKVVAGDSSPFWGLVEFQPKNDVNPPAGDLGLEGLPLMESSATPSSRKLSSGGRVSCVYEGILGIVGDRACAVWGP